MLVSGEPGIGKSRLGAELARLIETEPHVRLRYFCSPHHQDSALYPFIVQLERAARFDRGDSAEDRRTKLEALLALAALEADELELIAELLSLPNRAVELSLSPKRKREKLFEALLGQLEPLTQQKPVLMLFEDAHWIDPTSHELIDLIIGRVARLPVLLVVTFRPEFQNPWASQPHVTPLEINRLRENDGMALVAQLAGPGMTREFVAEIVERTDGVPLFIKELTRGVLENQEDSGHAIRVTSPAIRLALPATLHASLIARLDRLGTIAKEIAQVGAVLGREFDHELLRRVAQHPARQVEAALHRLTDAALVFARGAPPECSYLFKHALVQDAAYATLLRSRRRELHARAATVLEEEFGQVVDLRPELIAHHYAEAGLAEKSFSFWSKAGHRSAARSQTMEAAAQFNNALDQLSLSQDLPGCRRRELEIRSALGAVLLVAKGYAAPETGKAYARARELWDQDGAPTDFLHIPCGQSLHHALRGEFDVSQRLDDDLLRQSNDRNDTAGLVLGHLSAGRTSMFIGMFLSARTHLETALSIYDFHAHHSLTNQIGDDPYGTSQAYLAIVLFCLGHISDALSMSNSAIARSRNLKHLPSLAVSLGIGARLLVLIGDIAGLCERATELDLVATEQSFPYWHGLATIFRGWVAANSGEVKSGLSLMRDGLRICRTTGAQAWTPYHLGLMARAYDLGGPSGNSLDVLNEAFHIVGKTKERWVEAELYRQKGQLLLHKGDAPSAEQNYRKALGIAQGQEAKFWELRAATSLARLWGEQGRREEARELLAPVYGWFTEGFDTADLIEARTLLSELA